MLANLLLTEDQEEQDGDKGAKAYTKTRVKARTRQSLWNIKQERPDLFSAQVDAKREQAPVDEVPKGFEPCDQAGWYHNKARAVFLEVATGRRVWFDPLSNEYRDLREGATLALTLSAGAATAPALAAPRAVGSSASTSAGSAGVSAGSGAVPTRASAPRHIIVPDVHRTAQALKLDVDHLDKPSTLVAVFGGAEGTRAAPTEAATKTLPERLLRRLAAFRGAWTESAFREAVAGALSDVAGNDSAVAANAEDGPMVVVALAIGNRVVVAAPARDCAYVVSRAALDGDRTRIEVLGSSMSSGNSGCAENASAVTDREAGTVANGVVCHELIDPSHALDVVLAAGSCVDNQLQKVALDCVTPFLSAGRPRAASVALIRALRQQEGSQGAFAAACARLRSSPDALALTEGSAPGKRAREEAPGKIRIRQILLRFRRPPGAAASASGSAASAGAGEVLDPVRKKPVKRGSDDAEAAMLAVLEGLVSQGGNAASKLAQSFSSAVKAHSECQSALRGGELAGDLGWIDRGRSAQAEQQGGKSMRPALPQALLRAAFELEVGQLSDLVSSEVGVHLLLRSA
eukprot:TRINITY_DN40330_c0_g1_i1.p1 TRINITY_DN40330_c0_g1~~TRINITY_DN40330_c0_g1_i1.p1  ORF type:complete len:575 (-),score=104.00 TRINITY_DN40330_c0_g1_i1:80-1804(-)